MTFVTDVHFMDNSVTDTYDILVAIIDGEVRGVQNIGNMHTSAFGNRTSITVYANENPPGVAEQQVSFRLWDSNECSERWDGSVVSTEGEAASIPFEPDGDLGNFLSPVSVNFTNAIARNVDVSEGYTQISFNLQHGSDMSLNSFLQYLDKTPNDRIIGSSGFATWQGDVGSDSGALVTDGVLGDLHHQALPLLEEILDRGVAALRCGSAFLMLDSDVFETRHLIERRGMDVTSIKKGSFL